MSCKILLLLWQFNTLLLTELSSFYSVCSILAGKAIQVDWPYLTTRRKRYIKSSISKLSIAKLQNNNYTHLKICSMDDDISFSLVQVITFIFTLRSLFEDKTLFAPWIQWNKWKRTRSMKSTPHLPCAKMTKKRPKNGAVDKWRLTWCGDLPVGEDVERLLPHLPRLPLLLLMNNGPRVFI